MQGSDPKSNAGRPTDISELLGQVFTPPEIASRMAEILFEHRPQKGVTIIDPAIGPGTFQSALQKTRLLRKSDTLHLFDVDPEMVRLARINSAKISCKKDFFCQDYILSSSSTSYDYAILNPPYVRQEWLDRKNEYRHRFLEDYGLEIPGTSNLYVYFIAKVLHDLTPSGKLVCIVYDSWQSTRFGKWLSQLLSLNCSKIETYPVESQPFKGRLIDATIINATRNSSRFIAPNSSINSKNSNFDIGPFSNLDGFSRIDNLFQTKRGLRLKQSSFFICDAKEVSMYDATPFVKKSANIKGYSVSVNHSEAALLVKSENDRKKTLSELLRRLEIAKQSPNENRPILTWFLERPKSWFLHRSPPYAPLLFNYYLRNRPKHVFNEVHPYSDNFYGLTPNHTQSLESTLALLNSTCVATSILANSRNQGGGLSKIQLYEYRNVPIPDFTAFSKMTNRKLTQLGSRLISSPRESNAIIKEIDAAIYSELAVDCLAPIELRRLYEECASSSKRPRATEFSR